MTLLLLYALLLFATMQRVEAQPYHNEWIDYSKTYYKFPVTADGLYRISQASLDAAGLAGTPAQYFKLITSGEEVPIYTTEAQGPLASTGFIEFYGKRNTGKNEKELFLMPEFQMRDDISLFCDTAFYYLTLDELAVNARMIETVNTVGKTTITPEPFFQYKYNSSYTDGYSLGDAYFAGIYAIRCPAFDQGEGFTSTYMNINKPLVTTIPDLFAYANGPGINVGYTAVGGFAGWGTYNAFRNIKLSLNDSVIGAVSDTNINTVWAQFDNIPLSRIINNTLSVKFSTDSPNTYDYSFIGKFSLEYQRTFNFNNGTVFDFKLPANSNGSHLRIANFLFGFTNSILYDHTNRKRYIGPVNGDSTFYQLEPTATDADLTLFSQYPDFIKWVPQIKPITFTNFLLPQNQGDYLIITNHLLYDGGVHNYVEDYRAYRSSPQGGAFNAKVYDIDELSEQFAFGVKKNPIAIRNFVHFALANFTNQPKYALLLGKASEYLDFKYKGNSQTQCLNLIPTWGMPASDNLLFSANNIDPTPILPFGRLSVINGQEISNYLEKVKQYEGVNKSENFSLENKAWKKEVIQLVGGNLGPYYSTINNMMNVYNTTISDTFTGAHVTTYNRDFNPNFPNDLVEVTNKINSGIGLLSYFGHSSSNNIDFNLSNPNDYTNTNGKYPVFLVNGCKAGNVFEYNPDSRLQFYGANISENFLLTPNRGAIAFIANSDFGMPNYLHLFAKNWFEGAASYLHGQSLGIMNMNAVRKAVNVTGTSDFLNRANTEDAILHGDPAIIPFPYDKPDYMTRPDLISIQPSFRTVADDSLTVNAKFYNLGKSVTDSVWVDFKREFPDGRVQSVSGQWLHNLYNQDSTQIKIAIKGIFDQGTNYLIATIDPANQKNEMAEDNNSARIPFEVSDEEVRPVYPYQFAILNTAPVKFVGSTVNPIQQTRHYRFEIDTTELFNSPLLSTKDTVCTGGAVSFKNSIIYTNGTVYYWRIAPIINGTPVNWRYSSFQYLQGAMSGFGQSHFYQHLKSSFQKTHLDAASRRFVFEPMPQNLFVANGIWGISAEQDNEVCISKNGVIIATAACIGHSIIFTVFDSLRLFPWVNKDVLQIVNGKDTVLGRYGSAKICGNDDGQQSLKQYNFEFRYEENVSGIADTGNRKSMMDFLDSIPSGCYVSARTNLDPPLEAAWASVWKADTAKYGSGKSLYHSLYNQGFSTLDSMNRNRTFTFIFRKNDTISFKPIQNLSNGMYDKTYTSAFIFIKDTAGSITSPKFGPAKSWKELHWQGVQPTNNLPDSSTLLTLIGIGKNGEETVLRTYLPNDWDDDISQVDAAEYPWLRLKLTTKNTVDATPFQLNYWRLFYEPVPDGALSAQDHFVSSSYTLYPGKDNFKMELAFKNISNTWLDSTTAVIKIGDSSNVETIYDLGKLKPLTPGDTAIVVFEKTTEGMDGKYYALLQINRELQPVEQEIFNNFAYIPFEVSATVPLSLLDFTASAEQNAVRLIWKATNETDVKNYTLEHSSSSFPFAQIHQSVAKTNGAGAAFYTWIHNNPAPGINYYRLITTHKDGKTELSAVRQVYFGTGANVQVYPNPFYNSIKVMAPLGIGWYLQLFNVHGQRLLDKSGTGNASVDAKNLPAGMYLAVITNGKQTNTIKLEKK